MTIKEKESLIKLTMKHYLLYILTLFLIGIGSISFVFGYLLSDLLFFLYGFALYVLAYIVDTYNNIDNSNYY